MQTSFPIEREPHRLGPDDAGELLTLQRAAYVSAAQLHHDPFLPPLTQTLQELQAQLQLPALGIRSEGRLIGSVRWSVDGSGVAHIGRLVVAPDLQGRGLGTTLLRAAETTSGAQRFQLFTGSSSDANLRLYQREGYRRLRTQELQPGVEIIHLEKSRGA